MSRKLGSFTKLFSIGFKKGAFQVYVEPDTATTYTDNRVMQLPNGDSDQQLLSDVSVNTVTGKTMSGASNTFTNLPATGLSGVVPVANGGTNSSAALNSNRIIISSGGAIVEQSSISASRALVSDTNGLPVASAVTSTEVGYLSGVTSSIQTQLNGKQATLGYTPENVANKGVANGYASLDSGGKVPVSQLPSSIMEYKGTWDASTNTPTLVNGTGDAGDVYICSVGGTVNFGAGPITFAPGDWVIYDGSIWQKSINSNAVVSVNGATGVVTVNAISQLTGDVTAGPASGSQSQVATIAAGAVTNAKIAAAAGIDASKIASGSVDNTEFGYLNGVTSGIQGQLDGKASTALDNLSVSGLAAQSLLVGSSGSAVSSLGVGSNGQVLTVVGGAVAWSAPSSQSFKTNWITADGTTKAITHNLGTLDVVVSLYDIADGQTIDVDTITRTSTNVVTLTASEAPGGSGWRVLIQAV